MFARDPAFGHRGTVDQDDRDAPVEELKQPVVGVDVLELRLNPELAEEGQGVVTQMAALAGHEHDGHGSMLFAGGRK